MHEQKSQNEPNREAAKGVRRRIGSLLGYGLTAILVVGCVIWGYNRMPNGQHRDLSTALPWENNGLVLSEIEASWCNTAGNERMSKRTHLYPRVRLRLGAAPGKGRLDVIFVDSLGTQIGDTHYLRYENGQFRKEDDLIVKAEGDTATCWLETGFPSDDMFTLHRMNQDEALWRVIVYHRTDGTSGSVRLGQCSIPAEVK